MSMSPLRLRTQLSIATLAIISVLTGGLLFIVRRAVRSEIDRQVHESTGASIRAFESVQRQRELQLSRTAAMLAELPTLQALMTTEHAPTIQNGSEPFWKLAGSDLFLLASTDGRVLGFHVAQPGFEASTAVRDLDRSLDAGEDSAWWYGGGRLYWVFLRSIGAGSESNAKQLGVVAVGYRVDSQVAEQLAMVAGSQIVLATGPNLIASTLSPAEETSFQTWLGHDSASDEGNAREMTFGTVQYQVASVLIRGGPPAPVRCYVLVSLKQPNRFIEQINRTILILMVSTIAFAALLLGFVSRTITRPLDNLVSGVRALAAGDYAYSIRPRGSSEVAELGEAFSKMRGDLLASQQRKIATERIVAVGRAASSISHDLRHYLAAVVANAEFLYEADKLKLDRDEIYGEIQAASNQMTDLLDSLRDLARETADISPVPADLGQTLRRAREAVLSTPDLRGRGIAIDFSGDTEGVFDPRKIERAFFNLILNACEATAPWQGEIRVEALSNAESFEVRISDNGAGIPESIRTTLFDPFVSSGKPNGTGMGLAIVSKIVHDHMGTVIVERTSETGTTFLVRFPRSVRAVNPGPLPTVLQ
ncbi:MAG: HAMP domain-containing sensor histidine kinase [Candidatus Acidiferrales bacterium]|jgi:signal transduction histidine kinase